ncbi:MAG TPA: carboxypeptidase regulatory-like domain-containing protein [Verrucomicrobiae bacterium]|nr:carboxypeptidase regulatory-like domain-containing protein [Verrucomicrobiae bacterium]
MPALLAAVQASIQAVSAVDITGTVTLNGTPPDEQINNAIAGDPNCGKLHPEVVKTQFFVVGPNKELKDVVVSITGISGKSTGASAEPIVLDQKGCEYTPYIFAVQTGQKITVRTSDPAPILHNVHATPTAAGNQEVNLPQAAGSADLSISFPSAENFLKIKCDVHQWMFAYVTVVDHPYFAVSGADGKFKIANVPPGKYTIAAMHRKVNGGKPITKDIEVKDGDVSLDFTLDAPAPK